jgi:rRNA maturation endonuclease Nob1
VPDKVSLISNDILSWAITCEVSNKPFKLIPQEFKFCKQYGLPLPRIHPDVRHRERMKLRNPRQLWDRQCTKCSAAITSGYAPERKEKVYCEKCYLETVY